MDMYQKRKMRAEKKKAAEEDTNKKFPKIGISCDIGINGNHTVSIEISSFL